MPLEADTFRVNFREAKVLCLQNCEKHFELQRTTEAEVAPSPIKMAEDIRKRHKFSSYNLEKATQLGKKNY